MAKKHFIKNEPDGTSFPDWYWNKGLHDSKIICKTPISCPEQNIYLFRNCMEVRLDASSAMFDTTVKAIKFYNFKELTPINIDGFIWKFDELCRDGDKFLLKVHLFFNSEDIEYVVRFCSCEVIR